MPPQPQSIAVGDYVLEVGAPVGTLIGQRKDPTEPDAGQVKELARALKAQKRGGLSAAIGGFVAKGTEIADRCEQARSLTRALVNRELTVGEINAQADPLLDWFERLDKEKRWEDSRELARAITTLLALLLRWADLIRSIGVTLQIAERVRDFEIVAWARHELGTLQLAAGDLAGADRGLSEAQRLRREAGDDDGLAATERNMGELCRRARARLHERRSPRRSAYALLLAALLLLILGGLAGATIGGDDNQLTQASNTVPPTTTSHGGTTGTTGSTTAEEPSKPTLTVVPSDGGTVTSSAAAIDCPQDCKRRFDKGETVTLVAKADEDHAFTRWSDTKLCPGNGSCPLVMSEDREISAVFTPMRTITVALLPKPRTIVPSQAASPEALKAIVTSDPPGIKCALDPAEGNQCSFAFPASIDTVKLVPDPARVVWTGDCTAVNEPCQVLLDADHTVTADFTPR